MKMNYQLLGRSGLRVSDLCLGTMTFGSDWGGASREDAQEIYDAYREAGGNFLDTANLYAFGRSEKMVGELVAGHREEVVIATKYTNSAVGFTGQPGRDPNAGGNQRKNMVQAVEASLKRLGTDYIDLYWLHAWDGITPIEEVMRAFDDLVRAGKVLYIGISDAPAWVVAKSNLLAELRGWTRYVGLQIEYNLLERTVEQELIPLAKEDGLTVLAWGPLRSGVLSGKYLPEAEDKAEAETGRMNSEIMKRFAMKKDTGIEVVREVAAIAKELGATPAQVALAWLRTRPVRVIPILGARKVSQFRDNLGSLDVELSAEQVRRLDEVSAVPMGFPQRFLATEAVQAVLTAGMQGRVKG